MWSYMCTYMILTSVLFFNWVTHFCSSPFHTPTTFSLTPNLHVPWRSLSLSLSLSLPPLSPSKPESVSALFFFVMPSCQKQSHARNDIVIICKHTHIEIHVLVDRCTYWCRPAITGQSRDVYRGVTPGASKETHKQSTCPRGWKRFEREKAL